VCLVLPGGRERASMAALYIYLYIAAIRIFLRKCPLVVSGFWVQTEFFALRGDIAAPFFPLQSAFVHLIRVLNNAKKKCSFNNLCSKKRNINNNYGFLSSPPVSGNGSS
jgi:hypothetical protein